LFFSCYKALSANFSELYTTTCSNEIQADEVNASSWLDVNVSYEFVTIDNLGCVVGFITHNLEINNTAAALNISQEWLNQCYELTTGKSVVEFE
jgi:predicted transposase YbfD/YdcC